MSQIAQLSEAELEERFTVTGTRAIQFTLAGYAEKAVPFTVRFGDGPHDHFPTVLLAVLPEKGKLVFDCSGSADANRRFMHADEASLTGRPEGIHVQFSVASAQEIFHEGARAFAVPLPRSLLRLQRREFFRIETPRARPPLFHVRLPGSSLLNAQVHDLSANGIGLTAPQVPETLVPGLVLRHCRLVLPEDTLDIFTDAVIRHITAIGAHTQQSGWRIGLAFESLDTSAEHRIARYIARVEHERHELA